LMGGRRPWG